MKILVITGSPHKDGTSALLAKQFITGASEAGHTVSRFDAAFQSVHPCIACDKCRTGDSGCVHKDDMEALNQQLLAADMVVFVSPIYYYAMSAQIKTVIDRFYANDTALHGNKKCALLLTFADDTMESADGAIVHVKNMASYLDWEIVGVIAAKDSSTVADLQKTAYPKQAYELGRSL